MLDSAARNVPLFRPLAQLCLDVPKTPRVPSIQPGRSRCDFSPCDNWTAALYATIPETYRAVCDLFRLFAVLLTKSHGDGNNGPRLVANPMAKYLWIMSIRDP